MNEKTRPRILRKQMGLVDSKGGALPKARNVITWYDVEKLIKKFDKLVSILEIDPKVLEPEEEQK